MDRDEKQWTDNHPRMLPYCPQLGLIMLYVFEAVAAIASLIPNIFKRERKHSRRHYKKCKPKPNNGQEAVHLSVHKSIGANGLRFRKKKCWHYIGKTVLCLTMNNTTTVTTNNNNSLQILSLKTQSNASVRLSSFYRNKLLETRETE